MKKLRASHVEQLSLAFDPAPAAPAPPRSPREGDPRARRALAGADVVEYRLRRARRRTIGFQIDDEGLTVSAPRWVTLRDIEAAIAEKARWIRTKQREWLAWREKQKLPQVSFADGATLPYLGATITLRLRAEVRATQLVAGGELHLALPHDAEVPQIRDAVQSWLQGEAERVFAERIERFADRIGPKFSGWRLSSARSQWGSCTHDGRVRLNWRLVHFALPVIDYVVAHELAHLRELNHSPRFWRTVEQLLPGFEAARDEIKGVDMRSLPL
ncbi:MAG: M48 family metallopeptidase [Burkholderiaceae bacterium]|nr:M48 family metallopeptidase [Burkholderiaceae bacterium]